MKKFFIVVLVMLFSVLLIAGLPPIRDGGGGGAGASVMLTEHFAVNEIFTPTGTDGLLVTSGGSADVFGTKLTIISNGAIATPFCIAHVGMQYANNSRVFEVRLYDGSDVLIGATMVSNFTAWPGQSAPITTAIQPAGTEIKIAIADKSAGSQTGRFKIGYVPHTTEVAVSTDLEYKLHGEQKVIYTDSISISSTKWAWKAVLLLDPIPADIYLTGLNIVYNNHMENDIEFCIYENENNQCDVYFNAIDSGYHNINARKYGPADDALYLRARQGLGVATLIIAGVFYVDVPPS